MAEFDIKFPNTVEGRRSAHTMAGTKGYWEEHIDWARDDDDVISRRTRITQAIRQDADVSPILVAEVTMVNTADISTVKASGDSDE